ncbi:MAG: hypothetical protein KGI55_04355 [Gammaproteobacteria bacterium]|nr:hypothetical protein [Gammaproteobacteria bacterium]
MRISSLLGHYGGWRQELVALLAWLAAGALILPLLIYLCGVSFLGPLDGGGLGRTYGTVFSGLYGGAPSSWVVLAGPYALFLLLRLLRLWWRVGAAAN